MRRSAVLGALLLATATPIALAAPAAAVPIGAVPIAAVPIAAIGVPQQVVAPVPATNALVVRRTGFEDPRGSIRAGALSVVVNSPTEAVLTRFIASDYPFLARRAATLATVRNRDFVQRVLTTHTAALAPQVHAAAQRAADGTDTDINLFATTGYAAAKERDRVARAADGRLAAALTDPDRELLRQLAAQDPGQEVRAAAGRAAASDGEAVEFFAYGWADAAAVDLARQRIAATDADMARRATVDRQVAQATADEQAASVAGPETVAQAREKAALAWRTAAEQAAAADAAWTAAQGVADAQARAWQAHAATADGATGPNWSAVRDVVAADAQEWAGERQWAVDQSAYWAGLRDQALAGERRMLGTS